jgi:hypothetical protein
VAADGGSRRSNETSRAKKIVRILLSLSYFSMFSLFFFLVFRSFLSVSVFFSSLFPFLPPLCFPLFFFPSFSLLFWSLSSLSFLCFSSSFMVLSLSGPFFFLFVSHPLVFRRGKRRRESYYPCPIMAHG